LAIRVKLEKYELKDAESEDIMKPDDEKTIVHYENISVDSAIINWNKIKGEGRRVKHFYVELSDVKEKKT
jgi:hypothetical protein